MINKKTIEIGGEKFTLKSSSYRAMFLFEELTGKKITELSTLKDQIVFVYCILNTSNDDFPYVLEEFFDILDNDDSILLEFHKLSETVKKK